jgi:hypothetical protein
MRLLLVGLFTRSAIPGPWPCFLLAGLLAGVCLAQSRAAEEVQSDEKGTYLGALFSQIADGRSENGPDARNSPRGSARSGVLITHVLADSPASRANLRRQDILLAWDGTPIRDAEHLAQLIRGARPAQKVKLRVLRAGREETLEATLALGPVLKLSSANRKVESGSSPPDKPPEKLTSAPRLASVSVTATPLEQGKLRLTIEYAGTDKPRVVTCEGAEAIAQAVQNLPERERNLVRIALQRLRNLEKTPPAPSGKR